MSVAETPEERRARWRSVAVSSQAMPTRKAGNKAEWDRMARWEKEHDAARQLKAAGKQLTTLAEAPRQVELLNEGS